MDLIEALENLDKNAYADKVIYHVSKVVFENGAYAVTGIDSAALISDPSPLILKAKEESGSDRIILLLSLTDAGDEKRVSEVIIPRRMAVLASKPVRFVSSTTKEEVKSIDEIIGFSESTILLRDLLINETIGETPSNWALIPTIGDGGNVTTVSKNGKKQFQVVDTNNTKNTMLSQNFGVTTERYLNCEFFATPAQNNRQCGVGIMDTGFTGMSLAMLFGSGGKIQLWTSTGWKDTSITYTIGQEYHIRLQLDWTLRTASIWIDGVADLQGETIPPVAAAPDFVFIGTSGNGDATMMWCRNLTIWTGQTSGNEGDDYRIYGLSGSIARLLAIPLLLNDETRIVMNQLQWCQDVSTAWDYPLSLLATALNRPRESGETDLRLKRRLKPFTEFWSGTIPEITEMIADLADMTDSSLIKVEEYDPHYWGVLLPYGNEGDNAVWLFTENSEWEAFLEAIKPIATNILYAYYAIFEDLTPWTPTDDFWVGTKVPDFTDVFAPTWGHTQAEWSLDSTWGEGLTRVINTQIV